MINLSNIKTGDFVHVRFGRLMKNGEVNWSTFKKHAIKVVRRSFSRVNKHNKPSDELNAIVLISTLDFEFMEFSIDDLISGPNTYPTFYYNTTFFQLGIEN